MYLSWFLGLVCSIAESVKRTNNQKRRGLIQKRGYPYIFFILLSCFLFIHYSFFIETNTTNKGEPLQEQVLQGSRYQTPINAKTHLSVGSGGQDDTLSFKTLQDRTSVFMCCELTRINHYQNTYQFSTIQKRRNPPFTVGLFCRRLESKQTNTLLT